MSVQPTNLAITSENRLAIDWSDGTQTEYSVSQLRDACPCATCREKRTQPPAPPTDLPVLSISETQPLRILEMKPVGNYAYGLRFSDGHETGIYTLEFLRELAQQTDG